MSFGELPGTLAEVGRHAALITGFVLVMMLVIEYFNVRSSGELAAGIARGRWRQYVLAAFLGATPGCLGAFSVVSLYSHRVVSFGALVAAMVATSGDEAYVLFSMVPKTALAMTLLIFCIGLLSGYITDWLAPRLHWVGGIGDHPLAVHTAEECRCQNSRAIVSHMRTLSFQRALLLLLLGGLTLAVATGQMGPRSWDWIRVTLLGSDIFALFVVLTVPEHFLEEHLWEHVIKRHLLRIFGWTFGALLLLHISQNYLDVDAWIQSNSIVVLLVAVVIGIIPESGPHMIFVTLYASGSLPFGILLASSIVQDGHGALPLLAVSKRAFVRMKLLNLLVGLLAGGVALALQ
jgi:hypothetical protein